MLPEGTSQRFFYFERCQSEDAYRILLLRYTYGSAYRDRNDSPRQDVVKSEVLTYRGWVEYNECSILPDDVPKISGLELRMSRDEDKWLSKIQEVAAEALHASNGHA